MNQKNQNSLAACKISLFAAGIAQALGLILISLLLFLCLSVHSFVELNSSEISIFQRQSPLLFLAVPISLLLLSAFRLFLQKISCSKLLRFCIILYLIGGLYLIFNVDPIIRADASDVFGAAAQFNEGNYFSLSYGMYLFWYPHQLGLVTYDRILALFSENVQFAYLINLFWVICINYHLYLLSDLWFDGNALVNKYTIVFSFLFLPQFFFILFVYGTLPGLACVVMAVYHITFCLKHEIHPGKKRILLCVFFASAAVLLRSNYMIAVLSLICVLGLYFLKKPDLQKGICILLLALTLVLPQKLVIASYEAETGMDIGSGIPKSLWIAMGLQEGPMCSGWYNGYTVTVAKQQNYDTDSCNAIAKEEIRSRLDTFANTPSYAISFFGKKLCSTWCDPTFQSIWTGALPDEGTQQVHTPILESIYFGRKLFHVLDSFCNVLVVDILLLAFVYLIRFHNKDTFITLFPVIFLLGGFLFHLFWETKSQYVYMFIFMLIPLCAKAISNVPGFGFPLKHTKNAE